MKKLFKKIRKHVYNDTTYWSTAIIILLIIGVVLFLNWVLGWLYLKGWGLI